MALRFSSLSLACLLAVLPGLSSRANDSSAELGAGGLVLTRNADIEMRSEDLYVSAKEVRVNYIFFNRAARDVTVHVAFPMPDITGSEDPLSIPTEDPTNILDFHTVVNGRPVQAQVEQKVFVDGVEHTALLRSLNIPLAPHLRSTAEALDRLPPERWGELEKLQIAEVMEYDQGKGMQKHLEPRWTLKTTWHWEQTFPANTETRVQHRYKPATGASAGTSFGITGFEKEEWYATYQSKYCLDRDFLSTVARAKARDKRQDVLSAPFTEQRVAYILKTGANWAGPIRDFRMVVDKGAPDALVSFCARGVKKISPTQFEVRYTDFTPAEDLNVLILNPLKDN